MGFSVDIVDSVSLITDWGAVFFTVLVGGAISGAVSFGTVFFTLRGARSDVRSRENRTTLHKWHLQMESIRETIRGVKPDEELEEVRSSFRDLWLNTAPEHDSPAWFIASAFEVEMKYIREVDPRVSSYYLAKEKHAEATLRYQRLMHGPNQHHNSTFHKIDRAQKDQMAARLEAEKAKHDALNAEWPALQKRAAELATLSWDWLARYNEKEVHSRYRQKLAYEMSVAEGRIRVRSDEASATSPAESTV